MSKPPNSLALHTATHFTMRYLNSSPAPLQKNLDLTWSIFLWVPKGRRYHHSLLFFVQAFSHLCFDPLWSNLIHASIRPPNPSPCSHSIGSRICPPIWSWNIVHGRVFLMVLDSFRPSKFSPYAFWFFEYFLLIWFSGIRLVQSVYG
jgi:hypothetical protein